MVQNKKLLILVCVLAASLAPRFLLTRVRPLLDQLPVQSLPDRVGQWEALEVFVCPQCLEEIRRAVWKKVPTTSPHVQMSYSQDELNDDLCPVHRLPLTRTKDVPVSFLVKKALPPGTEFLKRVYRNESSGSPSPPCVSVTVVITGLDRRSIHRPEGCLQGQGWQIVSRDSLSLPSPKGDAKGPGVTRLVARRVWLTQQERKEKKDVVFYWFVGYNRLTGSNLKRVAYASWDRMFRGLNYRWGYVLAILPATDSVEQATDELLAFTSGLLPLMDNTE